jgi:hypothetical protein
MMNWKGGGRKRLWPNFKLIFQHLPGVIEENKECSQSAEI